MRFEYHTSIMRFLRLAAALFAAAFALPAVAAEEDKALLIQIQPDSRYRVWHAGAPSPLGEEDILALEAGAAPEGGRKLVTAAGLAQAFDTPNGVIIRLPALGHDKMLLIDRDGCGGIKVWHAQGTVHPTDEELAELVLTALPDGGQRVSVGRLHAKAYSTKIGVIAVVWKPNPRRPDAPPAR